MPKRIISVIITIIVVVSMVSILTGCRSDMPKEERPTITIAFPRHENIIDMDTNYLTLLLEEKVGVNLEFQMVENSWSEVTMMMASGKKLPDIIWNIADDYVQDCGEAGLILPMTEYLKDPEAMPNFHTNVPKEDRDYILFHTAQENGQIYGVPYYVPEIGNENVAKAWINTTWLDTLGLAVPKTTEELYQVLKAFKEQDPNGNGIQDEIPMIASRDSLMFSFLMNAFVYTDASLNNYKYLYIEKGQVVSAFTKEEWKKGLRYIHELFEEELLPGLALTQSKSQMIDILNHSEEQVVGGFTGLSMSLYEQGNENAGDMDVLPPLTGPDGACYATQKVIVPKNVFYITRDCENVEAAVRLLDAFYDRDVAMVTRFGEPEVDWSTNIGDAVTPYAEWGYETGFIELNELWESKQNKHWFSYAPRYMGKYDKYSIQGKGITADTSPWSPTVMTPRAIPYYQDKHPEELIYGLSFCGEEQEEAVRLRTAVMNYVSDSMIHFAVNGLSDEEWDRYLDKLSEMGLERYLELMQTGYERYLEKAGGYLPDL